MIKIYIQDWYLFQTKGYIKGLQRVTEQTLLMTKTQNHIHVFFLTANESPISSRNYKLKEKIVIKDLKV